MLVSGRVKDCFLRNRLTEKIICWVVCQLEICLMEEIPNNRLRCIKPCKYVIFINIYHINWWSQDFLEPSTVVWVFTSAKQFGRFSMSTGATDFWSINSFTSNIWWLYLLATRWTNFRGSSFTLIAENLPFAKWIYDLWRLPWKEIHSHVTIEVQVTNPGQTKPMAQEVYFCKDNTWVSQYNGATLISWFSCGPLRKRVECIISKGWLSDTCWEPHAQSNRTRNAWCPPKDSRLTPKNDVQMTKNKGVFKRGVLGSTYTSRQHL